MSVNNDQWVAGGFGRLGGICPLVCLGDLGVGLHALAGFGGNRFTLRTSARLDSVLWLGAERTVGLYPAVGASAYFLFPVGAFAEFCERTRLKGCGGTYFGFEIGGGLRLWQAFLEAVAGTGQLPAVTVTAGVTLPLWELFGCDPTSDGRGRPGFLVIGHHGSPNDSAENTIPSLAAAMRAGANAVEPDLCVTQDDVLVLWHDCDPDDPIALARESGAEGFLYVPDVPPIGSSFRRPVNQLTLSELREHFGYSKLGDARDSSAEIPTLAEFLDWARGEARLKAAYLDLKLAPSEMGHLTPLVSELSADDSLAHMRFVLLSTHTEVVASLEAERRRLDVDSPRVAYDSEEPGALDVTLSESLRDMSIGLTPARTWSGLKQEVAESVRARDAGHVDTVMVWTIDRETELAELLYYSVDGIITNDAALLHRMWRATIE